MHVLGQCGKSTNVTASASTKSSSQSSSEIRVFRLRLQRFHKSIINKPLGEKMDKLIEAMRLVVADTYAVIGQTHLCHWNVRGSSFFSLHQAFEEQYTELFTAVDEVAERIRAKGAFAPGGLSNLAQLSGIPEISEDADASKMVNHLLVANEKTLTDLRAARDLAGEQSDSESEDLMISRIQVHEKTVWMLKSFLG